MDCAGIASETDYSGLYLWRRIECSLPDGEQVLYVVPGLEKNLKYAIGLGPWFLCNPFSHFLLNHTDNLGDLLAVVQNPEENL